jgi:hypothetical protein
MQARELICPYLGHVLYPPSPTPAHRCIKMALTNNWIKEGKEICIMTEVDEETFLFPWEGR